MIRLAGPGGSTSDYEVVTLANVKAFMQITVSTDDTMLQMIVDGVNRCLFKETGRMLKTSASDFNDVLDSTGSMNLWLPEYPLVSVTSVTEVRAAGAGTFDTVYTYTSGTYQADYAGGRLILVDGTAWPYRENSVQVLYKAGWAAGSMPSDLVMALSQWAAVIYQRVKAKRLDVASLTTQDQSLAFTIEDLPAGPKKVIASYRRPEVGIV